MKNYLLSKLAIISLILTTYSCKQNPQKQAENLVKKQLETSLHDMNSYESVEFSTLDSAFSQVEDLEEYKNYSEKIDELKAKALEKNEYAEEYNMFGLQAERAKCAKEALRLLSDAMHYLKKCQELDSLFVPKFIGWRLEHTFRANNPEGHKVISHRVYYFDKDLTKIVRDEDNSKRESEE